MHDPLVPTVVKSAVNARHVGKIFPSRPKLFSLPVELICRILAFLPPRDLARCSQINRFVRDIYLSSSHLRYITELALHGMAQAPSSSDIPYHHRLTRLKEYSERWTRLKPLNKYSINMTENGCVYDFAGGIYANGHGSHPPVSGPLKFHRLPTATDDPFSPLKTWTHMQLIDEGGQFLDFCMDPTQDLLVMVSSAPINRDHKYIVHMRSLTTNEPHPNAPLPNRAWIDRTGPPIEQTFHHVRIHIVDDIVAILADDGATTVRLSLFNWRSDCDYIVTMENDMAAHVDDFCLLSRTSFLTVDFNGCLGFYTFTDPALYNRGASVLPPVRRARFGLPRPSDGWEYWGIILSFNPVTDVAPLKQDKSGLLHAPALFQCADEDRVLLCTFNLFNQTNQRTSSHTLIMRTRVFFESVPLSKTDWEDWGPENTRWFIHQYEAPWIHSIHGYRIVDKTAGGEGETDRFRLVIRDFNPRLIRVDIDEKDADRMKNVTAPTVVKVDEFPEEISTYLPYREVTSQEAYSCSNVMIDDSKIVLCQRDNEHHLEGIDVLVF
ncbi:hypothetical protein GLOTRDRAFT_117721 [Gloeophyllum trabeum ATCC 11539]|uniref:F-box domain-containing protein n=1 Tax=Gloeophyllum trabeum (strain ATCC 11539 / FP-39264 / Madison 617) TaxID=670483 RepID=S7PYC0_GLOTA|nr:uncharacterized protein GLOTRDRAFT_117721 [Gloeophyllum trabeum ATCC 11539]EPQ52347.1 hypothetical protein GLOTRDRAFT_117721 [Gloeophyllum trabeum ATCC 11539]